MNFLQFYEERIRPLETKEFNGWWETWYGQEFILPESMRVEYLSEKRWALVGWLARVHPDIRNKGEFMQILLDRQRNWERDVK
jgi:hypothetical protein